MKINLPNHEINFKLMRIKKEREISLEDLKRLVKQEYPDYQILKRTRKYFVLQKSPSLGCNVVVKKNNIYVSSTFPSYISQILFILSIFILGIIIPLALYYIIFFKNMKKFERELGEFIKKEIQIIK